MTRIALALLFLACAAPKDLPETPTQKPVYCVNASVKWWRGTEQVMICTQTYALCTQSRRLLRRYASLADIKGLGRCTSDFLWD